MNINSKTARLVMPWDEDMREAMLSNKWSPSTNITHAMEVEAEMFRHGWNAHHHHFMNKWSVEYWHPKKLSVEGESESLPEAICAASLKALEVK